MKRVILAAIMAASITGCAGPVQYTDKPMSRHDKDTEYRTDDTANGFTLTIYHSRYQYIPETDATATGCKQALTSLAYDLAESKGKPIKPINEQRIKMSFGRNGLTGITSCTAQAPVEYQ